MNSIVRLPKSKLITVFTENVSNEDKRRIEKLKDQFLLLDILVPVEQDPDEDVYYVVGKYAIYDVYYNEDDHVYCLLEEYSGTTRNQLIKIARRFLFHHLSSKTKQRMVDQLIMNQFTEHEIFTQTYFQPSQKKTYFYHADVPSYVISQNEQHSRPSSIATINQVTRMTNHNQLPDHIRVNLFARAHNRTLTQEQLRAVGKMLNQTEGFLELTDIQQKKVLQFVLCNQAFLIKTWQQKIDSYLTGKKL
ncbi:hypothetical protein [Bacillus suaedae]|uniref:Uncharacterized protein n=1 Tax=Halalkalibacter suaedae TaxID=2822140 RepID=A0A941AQT1_9BACI|nr:hypothetical protein [Bacillus suaedae]MBP3953142.1 hypothetical protein [Bacillus suaedae]